MRSLSWVGVVAVLTGACTSSPPASEPPQSPTTSPPATPSPPGGRVPPLRLAPVARLDQPVAVIALGDALYVAEKTGRVRRIRGGDETAGAVLDLSGEVSGGSEQGLLGIAFDPRGENLYVNYTDTRGDTHVVGYPFSGARADRSRARELLRVDQPFPNHNGGHLLFGPDGYLYVFLGDGGSAGDPGNRAQRLDSLLGKILRIDPSRGDPYSIPPGNPSVSRQGARPEIWAYGLRNPWRASFDRETGDLWIADVGQNSYEEIDLQPASSKGGENYGWRNLEGSHAFRGSAPRGHVPPVYEYPLSGGNCAVVGGVVYRGAAIPALRGRFLFADHCRGRLRALRAKNGRYVADDLLGIDGNPTAFGEDRDGEVYVLTLSGTVARLVPR